MRIERAHGESRLRDTPPPLQRIRRDPSGLDDPFGADGRDHVPQGQMRRHQHDAQPSCREHHGDGHVPGEVCQEFRDTGILVTGSMQRLLVNGPRDDGIDLTGQRLTRGRFDRLRGGASRLQLAPLTVVVPAAHDLHFRIERLPHRLANNLRSDAARITDDNRKARPRRQRAKRRHAQSLMSM